MGLIGVQGGGQSVNLKRTHGKKIRLGTRIECTKQSKAMQSLFIGDKCVSW